jgi:4-amino-4-deoxy-L-arabinose transferase-like glycosyltransferase
MADGGDLFVPHLFDRPYARKPPGMPWAVAASARLLGQTEFAARSVSALSATLLVFLSFSFARRWLGAHFAWAGISAGLAQATLPLMLAPATAAEIEMLHNLWAALAALCVIDLLVGPAASRPLRVLMAIGATLGTAGMIITKGPAALPVVGSAAVVGVVLAARNRIPQRGTRASIVVAALLGGLCLGASVLLEMKRRIAALPPELVVLQDPREFLWNLSRLGSIVSLPIVGWAAALPASLGVLLVLPRKWWGGQMHATQSDEPGLLPAVAVAWTLVAALLVFTVAGVSNARYTMPAMGLLGPCIAAVVMLWLRGSKPAQHASRAIVVCVAFALVTVAATVIVRVSNGTRVNGSGERVAAALSNALLRTDTPVTIWADGVIETRAEIPYYLAALCKGRGHAVVVRWWPILTSPPPAQPGDWYLLRHDADLDEWAQLGPRAGRIAASESLKGKWTFCVAPVVPAH